MPALPPVSTSALNHTRVGIQRAIVSVPHKDASPRDQDVAFVLRVTHHDAAHVIQRDWPAFLKLKTDLLHALGAGHACPGVCVWLWEDLHHNFDRPASGGSLAAWWHMLRSVHTKETLQIFLRHFQELLDSLLRVLHADDVKCPRFRHVTSVLCAFLDIEPKKRVCSRASSLP